MDLSIAAILLQDGVTQGAVYALIALALVLVFSVTRIIFIPQGEFVAYGALTIAALQAHALPMTALLLPALGALTFLVEALSALRRGTARGPAVRALLAHAGRYLLLPCAVWLLARQLATRDLPALLQVLLTMLIVVPAGPMLYRLVYRPLERAPVLVLLIASVALHLVLVGLGLLMFGADGYRSAPLSEAQFSLGSLALPAQSVLVVATALLLIGALYLYFGRTLSGKALRATAINGLGAQLVGIGTGEAGKLAMTLAVAIGTLCGVLIGPITTIAYDSGFLIALKGFVGAIFGGLGSYPLAAAGALLVGLLDSYSSFWASAFKEVIVFTLIIPVLLWRSLLSPQIDTDH
ncbi:MAG: branched-chain amino acid ABC transporter permease [Pseudomonadota bacterium]